MQVVANKRGIDMKKVLKFLFKVTGITLGVLFTIYMLNLDMKVVGFIYTWLNKFHDKKDSLRDIQF